MFTLETRTPRFAMWRALSLACLASVSSLAGCDGVDGSDTDRADEAEQCTVPEYGDGVCQTEIACAAPDIDCFLRFESQAEAEKWFAEFEAERAKLEFREPRTTIPDSDERFVKVRKLLDDGWAAYKQVVPVAKLGDSSPHLVLIDDPVANAFVAPDKSGRAAFVVMVQTGVLTNDASEDAMLGLMMHELEHAVHLHVAGKVAEEMRKFYIAGDGEPLGFEQEDDPIARKHGEAWRNAALEVGSWPHDDLGGLPLGNSSVLFQILGRGFGQLEPSEACSAVLDTFTQLQADVGSNLSALDASFTPPKEPLRPRIDAAMAQLRDVCFAGFEKSFLDIVVELTGQTMEEILETTPPDDLALVQDKHFIDAVMAVTLDRRAKMRAAEAGFTEETGQPWTRLRYFSFEEAADDASVPVLRAAGLAPAGLGEFLFGLQDEATQQACNEILADDEVPPYGADLFDEHHATCWRVDHVDKIAEASADDGYEPPSGGGYGTGYRRAQPRRSGMLDLPQKTTHVYMLRR